MPIRNAKRLTMVTEGEIVGLNENEKRIIENDDLIIEVDISLTLEEISQQKFFWLKNVADETVGNKIYKSIDKNGIPSKAIIKANLHLQTTTGNIDVTLFVKDALRYSSLGAAGYVCNYCGYISALAAFMFTLNIYTNNENDTVDAHLYITSTFADNQ